MQEVLTSIIFLFIKHPFDVGDRVNLEKGSYTVKEIRLLSTVFLDSNGTSVQAPNVVLNGMVRILNHGAHLEIYSRFFDSLSKISGEVLRYVGSPEIPLSPYETWG